MEKGKYKLFAGRTTQSVLIKTMESKQQTALNWYIEQVNKLEEEDGYLDIDKLYWSKQEALKMEREQIEQAYGDGLNAYRTDFCNRNEYYNQIYVD
jgi:hypothetical protein